MNNFKQKNRKGFTLIELLIVIAIIGILAAALLPTVLNAPARGRDAARIGNMNSIVAAIEAYNADTGSYPLAIATDGCINGTDVFTAALVSNYFPGGIPPKDPSGARADEDNDPGDCVAAGQYYYHHVGEQGIAEYIIGTVMELPQNNNTTTDLATLDDSTAADLTCTGSDCTAYVLIK